MKIKSLVIATALAGGLLSSASALTTATNFVAPAPVKTIQPILLPSRHAGAIVTLTMNIDAAGKPSNVRVMSASDQSAYKNLVATVSQWQFSPALRNGQPVSSRVELPLEVKGL